MQLYCATIGGTLIVLAAHPDGDPTPASAYGADAVILPYSGELAVAEMLGKPVPAPDLAAIQTSLKALVDSHAEALRATVITEGSGQAMEYQEARAEAAAALAAPSLAIAATYPMLAASIGIDVDPQTSKPATDVLGVARAITAAYTAWTSFGAAIRAARVQGKAAIAAATTVAEATAAYAAVVWPSAADTSAPPSA